MSETMTPAQTLVASEWIKAGKPEGDAYVEFSEMVYRSNRSDSNGDWNRDLRAALGDRSPTEHVTCKIF